MNGNNGKDEVSTTTPNVYDYEAENPPEKLTNPTEKYEKQKKIFKKSRNNTKKKSSKLQQKQTTEQIQEVFPKEIHEFLVRTHQNFAQESK